MKLPESFIKNIKKLLSEDEYEKYVQSLSEDRYYGIRINTSKISKEAFLSFYEKDEFRDVPWCSEGLYYEKSNVTKDPFYYAGLFYVQEPSAMSPGAIIPIEKGDKVLDLCAAPGGKTTQIAARLDNTGLIVANDVSHSRLKALSKNVKQMGFKNVIVTSAYADEMTPVFENYFDKILIDAPCSGEGMFRKDKNAVKSYEEKGPDYCIPLQRTILADAAKLLANGGYILYSTCTFSKCENEDIVKEFLEENENFEIINIEKDFGFKEGYELTETARLWPQNIEGEGHFLALLRKKGNKEEENIKYEKSATEKQIARYREFEKKHLNITLEGTFEVSDNKVYYLNTEKPQMKKIRLLKTGTYLGEMKNKKFEPSQELAMILRSNDFENIVKLNKDDINVIKYLKGETLNIECEDGLVLICVEDYPLGFGLAKSNKIKNKYDKNWRML